MLDLRHPLSKYVFAASRAEDEILKNAKLITVSSREDRRRHQSESRSAFAALRQLARNHFANRPLIPKTIDECELALAQLVELPGIPERVSPASHECPACGHALDRLDYYGFPAPDNPAVIYCSLCLGIVMPSLFALRSGKEGFGTDAI